ncbi:hypothetical protein AVEN_148962-1 [Araneus ventricosus]|uniref:Uncharacterized protein n=1 Tax=Araneus ventricosus TaxID=182803 RepID=A0A4Y2WK05_ARAVE|nr:hypothetical protein AVEN_148962-1 [Araneus ventricosus]
MSTRSSRTVQIRELCSPKTVKNEAYNFLTLLLSATQLAAWDPVISKTDPKMQHSKHVAMIGIRSINDHRSKVNSLFSFLPSLKSRFPRDEVRPTC